MLLSERIFQIDSEAAVALAELGITGRLAAADRWRVALVSVEMLLAALGIEPLRRRKLMNSLRDGYRDEHRLEPPFARLISDRFRTERARLASMFNPGERQSLGRGVVAAFDVLERRSAALTPLADELRELVAQERLAVGLWDFAASHVHMSLVRQLRTAIRAQEAVIYDFLARFYADPRFAASGSLVSPSSSSVSP